MSNNVLATELNYNEDEQIFVWDVENKQIDNKTENSRQKYIKIMEDYNSGDKLKKKKATDDMIQILSMFVYSIITKYFPSYVKYKDDMYQEGCLAILKNLEKYDPNIAMPSTFFFVHIKEQINTFIINNVNNISRYYGHNMIKIKKVIKHFEIKNQDYTNEDIAKQTGLSVEQVVYIMNLIKNVINVTYDNNEDLDNLLVGESETLEKSILDNEESKVILKILYTLDEDERFIVMHRMGFMGKCFSYEDIADMLNISVDKVRKKFKYAITKIKNRTEFKEYFVNSKLNEEEMLFVEVNSHIWKKYLGETNIDELEEVEEIEFI